MADAYRDRNWIPTSLGVDSSDGKTPQNLEIDPVTGGLLTHTASGLLPVGYDYVAYTNTSATVDTYKYYSGGVAGDLIATLTITYTDSSKSQVSTIART